MSGAGHDIFGLSNSRIASFYSRLTNSSIEVLESIHSLLAFSIELPTEGEVGQWIVSIPEKILARGLSSMFLRKQIPVTSQVNLSIPWIYPSPEDELSCQ